MPRSVHLGLVHIPCSGICYLVAFLLQLYSKLHASQVAGHAKNCQVYVVNFVEAADDPEYLGANFSRFYTPTCDSQDVSTVHVVLSRDKREAKILTSAGCITVHIDRDTVDGRPRILFRRRSATDW